MAKFHFNSRAGSVLNELLDKCCNDCANRFEYAPYGEDNLPKPYKTAEERLAVILDSDQCWYKVFVSCYQCSRTFCETAWKGHCKFAEGHMGYHRNGVFVKPKKIIHECSLCANEGRYRYGYAVLCGGCSNWWHEKHGDTSFICKRHGGPDNSDDEEEDYDEQ